MNECRGQDQREAKEPRATEIHEWGGWLRGLNIKDSEPEIEGGAKNLPDAEGRAVM